MGLRATTLNEGFMSSVKDITTNYRTLVKFSNSLTDCKVCPSFLPSACTYASDSRKHSAEVQGHALFKVGMDLLQRKEKFCHCPPLAAARRVHILRHLMEMGIYVLRTSCHSQQQHPAQFISQQVTSKAMRQLNSSSSLLDPASK